MLNKSKHDSMKLSKIFTWCCKQVAVDKKKIRLQPLLHKEDSTYRFKLTPAGMQFYRLDLYLGKGVEDKRIAEGILWSVLCIERKNRVKEWGDYACMERIAKAKVERLVTPELIQYWNKKRIIKPKTKKPKDRLEEERLEKYVKNWKRKLSLAQTKLDKYESDLMRLRKKRKRALLKAVDSE